MNLKVISFILLAMLTGLCLDITQSDAKFVTMESVVELPCSEKEPGEGELIPIEFKSVITSVASGDDKRVACIRLDAPLLNAPIIPPEASL